MKTLNITFNSTTPLLMNNNQGVNPLHPLSIELKKYTGKRKKTEEDNATILKIKWLLAIYYDEKLGPYMPAQNVEACIRDAAKKSKRGKDVVSGIHVEPDFIPIQYDGPRKIEELKELILFSDIRVGKIQGSSILINRPRFNHWKINFQLDYDEDIFNLEDVKDILITAGKYIGVGDYRQRYGKFEPVVKTK